MIAEDALLNELEHLDSVNDQNPEFNFSVAHY